MGAQHSEEGGGLHGKDVVVQRLRGLGAQVGEVELSPVPAALRRLQALGGGVPREVYQHHTHCRFGRKILLMNYLYALSSQTPGVFGWFLP